MNMPVTETVRLLRNSGLEVLGVSNDVIQIKDPTCFTDSLMQMFGYVWVVIAVLTAFLFAGWAFSLIRGGTKVDTIADNIRNLVIVFGALTAVGPIVNFIYGSVLWERPCDIIEVPMEHVQSILAQRNQTLRAYNEDDLWEDFDIWDSAAGNAIEYPAGWFENRDQVPAGMGGLRRLEAGAPPPVAPAPHAVSDHVIIAPTGNIVHAVRPPERREVVFTRIDGSQFRKIGHSDSRNASASWMYNNPGNIEWGDFARRHGALAEGVRGNRQRGFAIFPDEETGTRAMMALLRTSRYQELTVNGAINRWAPPFENDTIAYQRFVEQQMGVSGNTPMAILTDAQLQRMTEAMRVKEGWIPGRIQEI
jgi:hypothetical protein